VFFTCEELRVLIIKEGIIPLPAVKNMTRKEYKNALAMKERAQKYLEEEKLQKKSSNGTLTDSI